MSELVEWSPHGSTETFRGRISFCTLSVSWAAVCQPGCALCGVLLLFRISRPMNVQLATPKCTTPHRCGSTRVTVRAKAPLSLCGPTMAGKIGSIDAEDGGFAWS
jgi:hypothetical protein